jgi:hypothetical protein
MLPGGCLMKEKNTVKNLVGLFFFLGIETKFEQKRNSGKVSAEAVGNGGEVKTE